MRIARTLYFAQENHGAATSLLELKETSMLSPSFVHPPIPVQ